MAHKTLIGGTAYDTKGGRALVGGTVYEIKKGRTLVGGTGYDVGFKGDPIPVYLDGYTDGFGYVVINGVKYSSGVGTGTTDGGTTVYVYVGDEISFTGDSVWISFFGDIFYYEMSFTVPEGISAFHIDMSSDREYGEAYFTVT